MVAPQGTMSSQVAATLAAASANELAEFGAFPAGSAKSDRAPVALPPRSMASFTIQLGETAIRHSFRKGRRVAPP